MTGDSIAGIDFISALPDEILHLIFSFIPTKFAIRNSVLSKRWRHVWSNTPTLSIDLNEADPNSLNRTLAHYSAPKITSFSLCIRSSIHQINSLIEFAISRYTEKLSLEFRDYCVGDYKFPDFFYNNSSVMHLLVDSGALDTIPSRTVSWTALRNVLSGSPMLESLKLYQCDKFSILDLSKLMELKRLDIDNGGPTQIVAPHIHCLRLRHSQKQCGLVDVSSLTEVYLNIYCSSLYLFWSLKVDFLIDNVLKMLGKLQNVKKLTFGILSLAEICGLPFPMLKVEVLALETMMVASVIPGIAKLLQNSPGVNMIKLDIVDCNVIPDAALNRYLDVKGLDQNQCWKPKDLDFSTSFEPKLMNSFMESLLENTREDNLSQYNWILS